MAVNLPLPVITEVDTRLDGLRAALPSDWTRPQTWHLTLQFLGEWPLDRVNRLRDGLLPLTATEAFDLRCAGLGTFPVTGPPRVLFLHLQGQEAAAALAADVRAAVQRVWPDGPQDIKPFQGHLTVARFKIRPRPDARDLLRTADLGPLPQWTVQGFSLMSSRLDPGGALHAEQAYFPLRKKGEKNPLPPA